MHAAARGTWLAPLERVFWLEIGTEKLSMGDVVARVEALTQLAGDLDARLSDKGVGGLAGACAIYERLRDVLDSVSQANLAHMMQQVAALERDLTEVARRVAAIRELKALLDRVASEPG